MTSCCISDTIDSIEEAINKSIPVYVLKNASHEIMLRDLYKDANIIGVNVDDLYAAVEDGKHFFGSSPVQWGTRNARAFRLQRAVSRGCVICYYFYLRSSEKQRKNLSSILLLLTFIRNITRHETRRILVL